MNDNQWRVKTENILIFFTFLSLLGVPTLLVAQTLPNVSVDVNLDHLMTGNYSQLGNDTITFSHTPKYVYSVLFTTVSTQQ